MTQLEYIARQLSRAQKKVYEHYVVNRIWHQLDDPELRFVTQQYVKRPKGIALTDMYFPQLKLHVEIDERHHFTEEGNRTLFDQIREADLINVTGHLLRHVVVAGQPLASVHEQVKLLIGEIKTLKQGSLGFQPWDFDAEQDPSLYIKRGYIDIQDDVAFPTMVAAANCFGNSYQSNGIWTGGARHPEPGCDIWFPKLYENGDWHNSISADDSTIVEKCKNPHRQKAHVDKTLTGSINKRIVFARVKSPLGDVMYRFKGEYELDRERTSYHSGVVSRRTATCVKTYRPPMQTQVRQHGTEHEGLGN
jgi:hypothetical protein